MLYRCEYDRKKDDAGAPKAEHNLDVPNGANGGDSSMVCFIYFILLYIYKYYNFFLYKHLFYYEKFKDLVLMTFIDYLLRFWRICERGEKQAEYLLICCS